MNWTNVVSVLFGVLSLVVGAFISANQDSGGSQSIVVVSGCITLFGIAGITILLLDLKQTLQQMLARSLPQFEFIREPELIRAELIKTVKTAREFLHITGSAGRDDEYLRAIAEQVTKRDLEYIRVLYYRHVSKGLQEHLLPLFESNAVQVLYADEAHHGYFVLSEKVAILLLPNRRFDDSIAIKFTGDAHVQLLRNTFGSLLAHSAPIRSVAELTATFDKLKAIGN